MTQLYFALHNTPMANDMTFGKWDWENQPLGILCSFALKGALKSWVGREYKTPGVKTILDSGAFTAWKSGGKVIDLTQLVIEAERPDAWDEVVALDTIGNSVSSRDNALSMQKVLNSRGRVKSVLPVFHFGEPWDYLSQYKEQFNNRVALGGIATGLSMTKKMKWLEQCFARAYPCKFHGFGVGSKDVLMGFPFVSADTASWGTVHMFGRSQAAPGLAQPKLGDGDRETHYDLRFEIQHYLEIAQEVRERWANELSWATDNMAQLNKGL